MNATLLRRGMNMWPPFWGAGIKVKEISQDYRRVVVRLKLGLTNRNSMGVHFGGSLFSMTDPFYMIMIQENIGKAYVVWDQAAKIEFLKPGTGTVKAIFEISQAQVDEILLAAQDGDKVLRDFVVEVKDVEGHVVTRITKTIYVRKKRPKPS
jgi:acyl-coenzyme A thioesterase PaaI-like protein